MATSLSYVAVRDDKAARSLSVNEREFLRASAHAPAILRLDGRRGDEIRKVRMKLGRWDNGAECTVQWGVGTRVTALCTAELVPPSTDRPNEGIVNFTVDLSPMAGTAFRQAPPVGTAPLGSSTVTSRGPNFADKSQRLLSNRILRSIERIVLLGGALDTEALVLIHGSWVWKITVALTVLDDGGNVLDPCVMAALAALRHYRKPQVDVGESSEDQDGTNAALPSLIPATVKEPIPLPLHHTPLSISFALVPSNDNIPKSTVATLVDPEKREELVHFGALTVALNTHLEVCLLDYGGGHELSPEKLKACLSTAAKAVKHLCVELEAALEHADQSAQQEMLQSLQPRRLGNVAAAMEVDTKEGMHEMHHLTTEGHEISLTIDDATSEVEEAYRQQALDYAVGHVASSIREDDAKEKVNKAGGSLFTSLLKAAGNTAEPSVNVPEPPRHTANTNPSNERGAAKQSSKPEPAAPVLNGPSIESDDEEEKTIVMLSSEFGPTIELSAPVKGLHDRASGGTQETMQQIQEDGLMIDDLALAIKRKKGKKK